MASLQDALFKAGLVSEEQLAKAAPEPPNLGVVLRVAIEEDLLDTLCKEQPPQEFRGNALKLLQQQPNYIVDVITFVHQHGYNRQPGNTLGPQLVARLMQLRNDMFSGKYKGKRLQGRIAQLLSDNGK